MALDFIGGAAGGAAEGLESVLKRLFLEQQLRQQGEIAREQMEVQRRGHGVTMRGQDIDAGTARERLGLDREKLTEDTRQYNEQAPAIGRLRGAQAADLEGRPGRDEAGRAHDQFMAGLGDQFTRGHIRLRGDVEGGLIDRRAAHEAAQAKAAAGKTGPYADERSTRILQSVDELDTKVSPWTTGPGSLLSRIPASEARNFAAELNSLKSNIAFGELADMRAASKTGGALGAVSEKELVLLESALGALDPGQSPANFSQQLKKIKTSLQRWNAAKGGGGAAPTIPTTVSGSPVNIKDPLGIRGGGL